MTGKRTLPLRTAHVLALAALLLGLALADRGFTKWRNDPRTLPNANGSSPSGDATALQKLEAAELRGVIAGVGLVFVSVALFTKHPV